MAWVLGTLMLCTVRCLSVTSQWAQYLWVPIYVASANLRLCSTVVAQLLSRVWLFETPWTAARQASLSFIISWSLLKLMSVESVMPSNHLILCHPLFLLSTIFPTMKVFSNELVLCIMWLKYWSFSFSISPSNEYSGLISFRIGQGTLKSLLQHHSLKPSVLYCPTLTSVHEYWKNHSFDYTDLGGKRRN